MRRFDTRDIQTSILRTRSAHPGVGLTSLTSLPSTGHLSDGASTAVGYPHGEKPKGTFARGPTPPVEPLHSGIQPISRTPERPFGRNFPGTSKEEPPEARVTVTPPPFPAGKEESSLLETTS